jgi:hypothetical protein
MEQLLVDVNINSYVVYGKKPTPKEMAETLKRVFFTEGEDSFIKDAATAVNSGIITDENACNLITTLTKKEI